MAEASDQEASIQDTWEDDPPRLPPAPVGESMYCLRWGDIPPWMEPFGMAFDDKHNVPGGRRYHDVYRVDPRQGGKQP